MAYSTREKLLYAASSLFRRQGYAATGVAEILSVAGVPKGSLYHHFPGGKPDLAEASARWAAAYIADLIDQGFADAESFEAGLEAVCEGIAAIFEARNAWDFCPITATLLDGPENDAFKIAAQEVFADWAGRAAGHARRFGHTDEEAARRARALLMMLEGAWILARAEGSAAPIRAVAGLLPREDVRSSGH